MWSLGLFTVPFLGIFFVILNVSDVFLKRGLKKGILNEAFVTDINHLHEGIKSAFYFLCVLPQKGSSSLLVDRFCTCRVICTLWLCKKSELYPDKEGRKISCAVMLSPSSGLFDSEITTSSKFKCPCVPVNTEHFFGVAQQSEEQLLSGGREPERAEEWVNE